jgi:hypothetical protein
MTEGNNTAVAEALAQSTVPVTRKFIRDTMLSAKPETRNLHIFGCDVEVRQPTLEEVIAYQNSEDKTRAAAGIIQRYVYVPGTGERVFEEADLDRIRRMPFGRDMNVLQEAINDLMGLSKMVDAELKNLSQTPGF